MSQFKLDIALRQSDARRNGWFGRCDNRKPVIKGLLRVLIADISKPLVHTLRDSLPRQVVDVHHKKLGFQSSLLWSPMPAAPALPLATAWPMAIHFCQANDPTHCCGSSKVF
ncbi:hypothetical protein CBM2634_U50025 [Cupriavidus taiwanensis]|uniref:Uncharacterized protein n=1 Tax=Cupriavidus taiwanensis TaxID=164546 RepID=A0A375JDC8_9BURK|nr:hypothetical protein CBM2634_U50025 [Cupriavidus taiwanensis]